MHVCGCVCVWVLYHCFCTLVRCMHVCVEGACILESVRRLFCKACEVCIKVCLHICMSTCVCVCVHVCAQVGMHVCGQVHVCVCMCVCGGVWVRACVRVCCVR